MTIKDHLLEISGEPKLTLGCGLIGMIWLLMAISKLVKQFLRKNVFIAEPQKHRMKARDLNQINRGTHNSRVFQKREWLLRKKKERS